MKIKLKIEYDGAEFFGWQKQGDLPTVQKSLEDALAVYLTSLLKEAKIESSEMPQITASGRTDTGVHAKAQIASFCWPTELKLDSPRLKGALNGLCAAGIVVKDVQVAPDDFDARRAEHVKCYNYYFSLRRSLGGMFGRQAWAVGEDVEIVKMIQAARYFVGTHDFSAFRASDCMSESTVRTMVFSEVHRMSSDLLVLSIGGKGFLKQMVRNIAGTLAGVGWGKIAVDEIPKLIAAKDRTKVGQTAPAHGLTLEWVRYL